MTSGDTWEQSARVTGGAIEVSSISSRSDNGASVSAFGAAACVGVPFPLILRILERVRGDFAEVGGALTVVRGVMVARGEMEGRGDRTRFLSPLLPLLMFAAMVPSKKWVSRSTCLRGMEGEGEGETEE